MLKTWLERPCSRGVVCRRLWRCGRRGVSSSPPPTKDTCVLGCMLLFLCPLFFSIIDKDPGGIMTPTLTLDPSVPDTQSPLKAPYHGSLSTLSPSSPHSQPPPSFLDHHITNTPLFNITNLNTQTPPGRLVVVAAVSESRLQCLLCCFRFVDEQ